ncbi:MAG: hypothetical protein WC554_13640 [Clostridia bacterium]|jgi:DnaJ-class molecular chaperone
MKKKTKKKSRYIIEMCLNCDGCGWTEGGKALKTTCKQCKGTGKLRRKYYE